MQPTKTVRALLITSGLVAVAIGASILFVPEAFHASNGIELAGDASSMSEVRAPGGALLLLGALMIVGVFRRAFTLASLAIAAAVYLSYGLARLVSVALDGVPASGLVAATGIELVLGAAAAALLLRHTRMLPADAFGDQEDRRSHEGRGEDHAQGGARQLGGDVHHGMSGRFAGLPGPSPHQVFGHGLIGGQ